MPFKMSTSVMGIDISSDAVRTVYLTKNRGKIKLEYADAEPLPSGAVSDSEVLNGQAVAECIRSMLGRSKVRVKKVATAIPATSAIIKVINISENLDEHGIDDYIRYQDNQHIPYSMDAVNFDFAVLGPDANQSGSNKVLLVACKKEAVDDISAAVEEAGLKPYVVDVKPMSLILLSNRLDDVCKYPDSNDSGKSVLIVDIGYSVTNLYAFHDGYPTYSREHGFGAVKLIESIQNRYNLSAEDAQRMERFGGLPNDYATDVLQPFSRNTAQEVFRSLDFFQASNPDTDVSRVRIAGYGGKFKDIKTHLEQMISFPVDIMYPFDGMAVDSKVNQHFLETNGSSMAVACGLALRSVI